MVQGIVTRERMEKRKIVSPEEYGFHKVIVPGREDCQEAAMYRLNLAAGQRYELKPGGEEMNGVCIKGEAGLELAGRHYHCGRFDSFYTAGGNSVVIESERGFYDAQPGDSGFPPDCRADLGRQRCLDQLASPGTRNAYFWVLAAHTHESRGYDLAVLDPRREQMN